MQVASVWYTPSLDVMSSKNGAIGHLKMAFFLVLYEIFFSALLCNFL